MSRARRIGAFLLTVAVVCAAVGSMPATVLATEHGSGGLGAAQLGNAGIEPDGVLLRVDLRDDGSARWTVEYRIRLNDENTTAAFTSLRDDIAANETAYTATFGERMASTARAAENTTGREMRVENVSVSTARQQLPQEYGVVTYRFTWQGFATTTGDVIEAGDALAGLFLDQRTTLVVAWPDGYGVTAVDPTPDERRDDAVVWAGPTDFDAGQPALTLSTAATDRTSTDGETSGGAGAGGEDGDGSGDGTTAPLALVGGAAVLAIGVAAAVAWRRLRGRDGGVTLSGPSDTDSVGDEAGQSDAAGAGSAADSAERGETEASTETADGAAEGTPDPWADELLSNEERVLALLEHNDGRMKQQTIASELEWSAAKTSQVIGKMRDAGDVETFRLGRENVVSFPDRGLSDD
ncbi:DUF7345 domain-containing protein [Salinigranum salinum]|uniref:DUF7345 domain-containing protein n=1 Tax=Salinigranum salinum TaxID=1364937 RepID=UPI001260D92E|nr:DUF4897 domain-containing protein [Salinigranum salinum]